MERNGNLTFDFLKNKETLIFPTQKSFLVHHDRKQFDLPLLIDCVMFGVLMGIVWF